MTLLLPFVNGDRPKGCGIFATRRCWVHAANLVLVILPLLMLFVWAIDPFAHLQSISIEQQTAPSQSRVGAKVTNSSEGSHQAYAVSLGEVLVFSTVLRTDASLRQPSPTEQYPTPHPEPTLTIEKRQRRVMINVKLLGKIAHYLWSHLFFYLDGYSMDVD
jgi:hypothetical protein